MNWAHTNLTFCSWIFWTLYHAHFPKGLNNLQKIKYSWVLLVGAILCVIVLMVFAKSTSTHGIRLHWWFIQCLHDFKLRFKWTVQKPLIFYFLASHLISCIKREAETWEFIIQSSPCIPDVNHSCLRKAVIAELSTVRFQWQLAGIILKILMIISIWNFSLKNEANSIKGAAECALFSRLSLGQGSSTMFLDVYQHPWSLPTKCQWHPPHTHSCHNQMCPWAMPGSPQGWGVGQNHSRWRSSAPGKPVEP